MMTYHFDAAWSCNKKYLLVIDISGKQDEN